MHSRPVGLDQNVARQIGLHVDPLHLLQWRAVPDRLEKVHDTFPVVRSPPTHSACLSDNIAVKLASRKVDIEVKYASPSSWDRFVRRVFARKTCGEIVKLRVVASTGLDYGVTEPRRKFVPQPLFQYSKVIAPIPAEQFICAVARVLPLRAGVSYAKHTT